MSSMRINRAIAQAGVCSRRAAEQLISSGQVRVNDKVVTDLATTVDIRRDRIKVRGKLLHFGFKQHYYVYYKPRGIVSTMQDELGRQSVGELCATLPGSPRPVGRLDRASEGLMLLCSDGELANRMTHPRYGVSKEYRVTVRPRLSEAHAQQMVDGVQLEDGEAHFNTVELVSLERDRSRLNIELTEGRNRIIRRVCEALGYEVLRLKRQRFGPLVLDKLSPGEHRAMTAGEVRSLRRALKLEK
ncbi:rRNA pseudouridine synthase [bacterium]|nr:rRNA pseudouridine synthase [bacterium]